MGKQVKILIALCGVFVVLVGATLWFVLGPGKEDSASEETSSAAESTSITLVARDYADFASVSSSTGFYAEGDGNGSAVIPALDGVPQDSTKLEYIARFATNITGQQEMSTEDGLSKYGLDDASCSNVTITYTDGSTSVLKIGADVPGAETSSNYVLYDGRVFVMYNMHIRYFVSDPTEFVDTSITAENYDSAASAYVYETESIDISYAESSLTVNYSEDGSAITPILYTKYSLTSLPAEKVFAADTDASCDLIDSAFGLSGTVAAYASDVSGLDLAAFGLDEPFCTVSVSATGVSEENSGAKYSFTLLASAAHDGKIYVMLEGRPVVYELDLTDSLLWYSCAENTLYAKKLLVPQVDDTAKVTLETPDGNIIFAVNRTDGNVDSVDVLSTYKTATGTASITGDDFTAIFDTLTSAEQTEYCGELFPGGEGLPASVLKITYLYTDGESFTLELFEGQSRRLYATADGVTFWLVNSSFADSAIDAATGAAAE